MTRRALFVRLEAKSGKENDVAKFLRDGQSLVLQEPATTAWFGIQFGPTTFGIFDAFPDESGRDCAPFWKGCRSPDAKGVRPFGAATEDRKGGCAGGQATAITVGDCQRASALYLGGD